MLSSSARRSAARIRRILKVLPPGGNRPDEPGFYWVLIAYRADEPRWEVCEVTEDLDVDCVGTEIKHELYDDMFVSWGSKLQAPG